MDNKRNEENSLKKLKSKNNKPLDQEVILIVNENSPRVHGEKNQIALCKSLQQLGTGRSILADKDGKIIAGNEVYRQAINLNIPCKIIETNGKELVALKRTDLELRSVEGQAMTIADNRTSDLSVFSSIEVEAILNSLPEDLRIASGFSPEEQKIISDDNKNPFIETELELTSDEKTVKGQSTIAGNKEIEPEKLFNGQVICCPACGFKFELKDEEKE